MKNSISYLPHILFLITVPFFTVAQDFDEDFLKSLPEEVQEDLMKRKSDKEELEEDRYRRPSSYVEKKNSRKKIEELQKELDLLRGELLESEEDKVRSNIFGVGDTDENVQNAMYALRPLLKEVSADNSMPSFSCTNTYDLLRSTTLSCPPMDRLLLHTYLKAQQMKRCKNHRRQHIRKISSGHQADLLYVQLNHQ